MLEIYSPFVTDNCVSFELQAPSESEFIHRIETFVKLYPWLVAEQNERIAGYAYASVYRERLAYQWCVECSVYIHPEQRGNRVGKNLYQALFSVLKHMGICNAYAIITLPNDSSVAFHRYMDFEEVGVFRRVGFKFGSWHDVYWMVKYLSTENQPSTIKLFSEFSEEEIAEILAV